VRNTKTRGRVSVKRVAGRDFVKDAVTQPSVQARAVEVMNNTIMAFLNGTIKYRGRRG
jgi:hypothetical protein